MSIHVLLVDQHEIMRAGIKSACRDEAIEFVGELNTLCADFEFGQAIPDVIIVDPDCLAEGLQTVSQLHAAFSATKILVVSANDSRQYAAEVLSAGAVGYLIKTAGLEEIPLAIRLIHEGRVFISHTRETQATGADQPCAVQSPSTLRVDAIDPLPSPHLSQREKQVLWLLAEGMTNKQVAEHLYLSVKTIETYRARIMKKHGLRDRVALTKFAREAMSQDQANQQVSFTAAST